MEFVCPSLGQRHRGEGIAVPRPADRSKTKADFTEGNEGLWVRSKGHCEALKPFVSFVAFCKILFVSLL
jgi:hypothetical protein